MAGRTPRQPEVVEQPRERAFVGLLAWTTEEGLFSDAPALARSFGKVKESIPRRALPVVTAVVAFEPGFVPEGVAAPRDGGPGDPAERGAGGPAGAASFAYFMGDEVEPDAGAVREALAAAPGLVCVRVPAGTALERMREAPSGVASFPVPWKLSPAAASCISGRARTLSIMSGEASSTFIS